MATLYVLITIHRGTRHIQVYVGSSLLEVLKDIILIIVNTIFIITTKYYYLKINEMNKLLIYAYEKKYLSSSPQETNYISPSIAQYIPLTEMIQSTRK